MTANFFTQRRAGVLLHISSLPGGDLGADAYRFVDFLAEAGQGVWQVLPIGPTHDDGSPYQCLSLHAGNPLFISAQAMREEGWLTASDMEEAAPLPRHVLFARAHRGFQERATGEQREAFRVFADSRAWLADYALYRALREAHAGKSWTDWPAGVRDRDAETMEEVSTLLRERIALYQFEQFVFFRQWAALRRYANSRGVLLFGDLPIFVAHDSADVWARPDLFMLDKHGQPTVVAGVPPDYFSETGQRWGNPLYRWDRMEADGFQWWQARVQGQLELFDLVRIDHFRGFEAYWEIPAHEQTARAGRWVKGPGDALFDALRRYFDPLPIVAEDLGIITPEVTALRERHALPGMKILQFAFDGGSDNPYLPQNHEPLSVVYTGTHDNDTTLGWYAALPARRRQYIDDYLGAQGEPMPWPLIRAALESVAHLAIIPMQDVLALGSEARMNTPGTTQGNWQWRFEWQQIPPGIAGYLRHLTQMYGRAQG